MIRKPFIRIFATSIKQLKCTRHNEILMDIEFDNLIDEVDMVLMLIERHQNFKRPEVKRMIREALERNHG